MTKKSTRRPDPIKELIADYDAMTLNQLFDTRIRLSAEVAKSKVTWQMARRRLADGKIDGDFIRFDDGCVGVLYNGQLVRTILNEPMKEMEDNQ